MNRKLQYILFTSLPYGCKLIELKASATTKKKKKKKILEQQIFKPF